jgi:hypothetical protein
MRFPDLLPDLARGGAQRPLVALAQHRDVRVVVQVDQIPAPAHPDRVPRVEGDLERGLQALRPDLQRAERRAGPVERTDAALHVTATGEEVRAVRGGQAVRGAAHRGYSSRTLAVIVLDVQRPARAGSCRCNPRGSTLRSMRCLRLSLGLVCLHNGCGTRQSPWLGLYSVPYKSDSALLIDARCAVNITCDRASAIARRRC